MTTPQQPAGDAWQNTPGMSPEQPPPPQQWGGAPPPPPPPGGGGYGGGPGGPGGYGAPPAKPSNGLGTASLVLGIIGLLTFWLLFGGFLGLVAVILGFVARGKVKRGEATNGGAAMTGIVTGLLALIGTIVIVVAVGTLFGRAGFSDYASCVEAAGEDQAKLDQCAEDFADRLGGQ